MELVGVLTISVVVTMTSSTGWIDFVNGLGVLVPGVRSALSEQVVLCHDRTTGLRAVIAIDDTTLGQG